MNTNLVDEDRKNINHATKYWDSYPLVREKRGNCTEKEFAIYYNYDVGYGRYLYMLQGGTLDQYDRLRFTLEEAKKEAHHICRCRPASAIVYNLKTKALLYRVSSETVPFSKQEPKEE